ncbi:hypothetical protein KKG31_09085 [Patescibacteria group bacterium]|nr:hypothetical protein [Patescibacteria group bacterium]MBU1759206.1 hypothetical protein [Patescibacteria group bacterium]MBU1907407.1 hypothetical protein [Patescibacteria group bacterium]
MKQLVAISETRIVEVALQGIEPPEVTLSVKLQDDEHPLLDHRKYFVAWFTTEQKGPVGVRRFTEALECNLVYQPRSGWNRITAKLVGDEQSDVDFMIHIAGRAYPNLTYSPEARAGIPTSGISQSLVLTVETGSGRLRKFPFQLWLSEGPQLIPEEYGMYGEPLTGEVATKTDENGEFHFAILNYGSEEVTLSVRVNETVSQFPLQVNSEAEAVDLAVASGNMPPPHWSARISEDGDEALGATEELDDPLLPPPTQPMVTASPGLDPRFEDSIGGGESIESIDDDSLDRLLAEFAEAPFSQDPDSPSRANTSDDEENHGQIATPDIEANYLQPMPVGAEDSFSQFEESYFEEGATDSIVAMLGREIDYVDLNLREDNEPEPVPEPEYDLHYSDRRRIVWRAIAVFLFVLLVPVTSFNPYVPPTPEPDVDDLFGLADEVVVQTEPGIELRDGLLAKDMLLQPAQLGPKTRDPFEPSEEVNGIHRLNSDMLGCWNFIGNDFDRGYFRIEMCTEPKPQVLCKSYRIENGKLIYSNCTTP